jgi:hypothetical protein
MIGLSTYCLSVIGQTTHEAGGTVTTRLIKNIANFFFFFKKNKTLPTTSGLSQWHGNTVVCHEPIH